MERVWGPIREAISANDRGAAVTALNAMRNELSLYPYTQQHGLMRLGLQTPFEYYRQMMLDAMRSERSYDSLPNFSAADCQRLLRVGRNEFIATMNATRSEAAGRWGARDALIDEHLPSAPPADLPVEPWWIVHPMFSLADLRAEPPLAELAHCTDDELSTLEVIAAAGCKRAGELSFFAVRSLHRTSLAWLRVPIVPTDRIAVPPLQGFVMNRGTSSDRMERLLYQVLLSTDQSTTIEQLARLLGVSLDEALGAVAVGVLLGFVQNRTAPSLADEGTRWHASWLERSAPSALAAAPLGGSGSDGLGAPAAARVRRIGLLVDSKLAACLMMANMSSEVVMHAVTLYEAGKMPDETLDGFIAAAARVALPPDADADLVDYYEHVAALSAAIRALRAAGGGRGVDVVRAESVLALEPATCARLLHHQYECLVSMVPFASARERFAAAGPPHFGAPSTLALSPWAPLYLSHRAGRGPRALLLTHGTRLRTLPRLLRTQYACVRTWAAEGGVFAGAVAAAVHPSRTLLRELNDALLDAAVLVSEVEPDAVVRVLLPVAPAGAAAATQRCEPAAEAAAARAAAAVGLPGAPGFADVMKLGPEWLPLELEVGLPLYTVAACADVCAGAKRTGVFDAATIAEHGRQSAAFASQLLAFAARLASADAELPAPAASPDAPPPLLAELSAEAVRLNGQPVLTLPCRAIVFDGVRVRELAVDVDL
jgi:hypothetical protein